jgi:DNA polymerase (family 10)
MIGLWRRILAETAAENGPDNRMDKWQVSRALDEIARYIELSDPNRFKAQAFERAARRIEALDRDVVQLVHSGSLYEMPGIGKAIGPIIAELVETGGSGYLNDLRKQYPPGIFALMRVPGLGLKKIGLLYEELGISTVDELEQACRGDRLKGLRGFGAKTQQKLLEGIGFARSSESSFLLPSALEIAEPLCERLAKLEAITDVLITGSVRRRMEIVHNLNLAISAADPQVIATIERAALLDDLQPIRPGVFRGRARNEMDVLLHMASPDDFGIIVLESTGSPDFVSGTLSRAAREGIEPGVRWTKGGKVLHLPSEESVFEALEATFVEPELREKALPLSRRKRPPLVSADQLQGTFHVHTTFSDGRNTVYEMLDAARARDFSYVGLSDHSKTAAYAGGLTVERVAEQQAEIDHQAPAFAPMRVFKGTEADILADGSIDYDSKTLSSFDFVIASVHSRFNVPKDEMTDRIVKALGNPFVTFLGHITGRLLLAREGYEVDFESIFDAAAENGVLIEINGNPHRLDLDWRHIRKALDRGVRFSINPDAHSTDSLGHVISGTWVARKGGLRARDIFNTAPVEEIAAHLAERRRSAMARTKTAARGESGRGSPM